MGQDFLDRQYMNTEYPFPSSKMNFRSGNTVDQNNSNIVNPDHDYWQNQHQHHKQRQQCTG